MQGDGEPCPFCRVKDHGIEIMDNYEICSSCGYVLRQLVPDSSFEGRIVALDLPTKFRGRTGGNIALMKKRTSMGPSHSLSSKRIPYALLKARNAFLDSLISTLKLGWSDRDRRKKEVVQTLERQGYSFRNYGNSFVSCVLLAVCRRNHVPISFLEVSNASGIDLYTLGRRFKSVDSTLFRIVALLDPTDYLQRVLAYTVEAGYRQARETHFVLLCEKLLGILKDGEIPVVSSTYAVARPDVVVMSVVIIVMEAHGFSKKETQRVKKEISSRFCIAARNVTPVVRFLKKMLTFFCQGTHFEGNSDNLKSLEEILEMIENRISPTKRKGTSYMKFLADLDAFCGKTKGMKLESRERPAQEGEDLPSVSFPDRTTLDNDGEDDELRDLDVDKYIRTEQEIRLLERLRNEREEKKQLDDLNTDSESKSEKTAHENLHGASTRFVLHMPYHHPDLYEY